MLNGTVFEDIDQSMGRLSIGADGAQPGQTAENAQANFSQQQANPPAPVEDPMARYRVFVGGISWKATEQDLGQFFSQFGNVIDCKIIFDKVTHKSKGYGFVTFDNEESVRRVLEAKQQNAAQLAIFGKAMDVGHAVRRNSPIEDPNAPKPPPAQRGGYGYGQRPFGVAGRFPPGAGYPQQNFRGGRGGRFQQGGYDHQAYGRGSQYGYGQPYVDPQQWAGYGKGRQQLPQQYWQGQVAAHPQYDAANAQAAYYPAVPQGADDPTAATSVQGFGGNFGMGQAPAPYGAAFAYGDGI